MVNILVFGTQNFVSLMLKIHYCCLVMAYDQSLMYMVCLQTSLICLSAVIKLNTFFYRIFVHISKVCIFEDFDSSLKFTKLLVLELF